MRYKNIIFDIGGVLLSYRWLDLMKETIPDEDKARAFARRLFNDPLWLEFDIGLRPFDDIIEDYTVKYPEDEAHIRYVLGHLERMPVPRPRVWEKLLELKKAGYKIYILSNYSDRMFHTHTDGLPFPGYFDGRVISYEVHHLKPHKEIYEILFSKYGLNPGECLFFDDRQDNVDGGRKCGMEGRVIYSEEVLLGYIDRLLAKDGISNIFHDPSYTKEERIGWLLSRMSTEEKILLYSHPERGVGRFGVEGFVLGGEAAHGVEARNEQNGIGDPDTTTSFPDPIGMSASWDPELLHDAGRIVGEEARACFKRHRRTGLSRWAPTIDMERDSRWGRNEEGYGEDPYLTSKNAVAYIKGMQGDDPEYIMCGATLKHFYANNTEKDRFFSNSSVGIRDKHEYYLPAFISALDEGGAMGIMTAYNKINGVPGMTDPEVRSLLKERHGLIHAVSDGFAMVRLKEFHHEYGTLAECLGESLRAGVDSMSDKPEDVERALRDALELSVVSESELDNALHNILMVGMKLGIYDPEGICPYDYLSSDAVDTARARDICLRLTEESLVLLENKNDILPLSKGELSDTALIGPLADEWMKDWYGGNAPFRHSVKDGISALTGSDVGAVKGLDTYKILYGDKAWHIEDDGSLGLRYVDEGDIFYIEDWNDGNYTIRSTTSGKYVQSVFYGADEEDKGLLRADKDDVFDWFVTCRFHIKKGSDGSLLICDRFLKNVGVDPSGRIKASDGLQETGFRLEKISDGISEALSYAEGRDKVILVLGCNPLIPAREDFDRISMSLPDCQQKLWNALIDAGKKVITVLISNYPYIMDGAEKRTDALLLSASGSEYMGDAIAAALFGDFSPSGRLVQGWPLSEEALPDINDYRVIGQRTYRYVSDNVLYTFGYGLTYGKMRYLDMKAQVLDEDGSISIELKIENTGIRSSDEVVEIYASADFKDERFTEAGYGRRLIAFKRVKDIRPGETVSVSLTTDAWPLRVFDAVRNEYILYEGDYHVFAGDGALEELAYDDVHIKGQDFMTRDLSGLTPVYACDDYENVEFVKGSMGMTAAAVLKGCDAARLSFFKCLMPEDAKKAVLILRSEAAGEARVLWNGEIIAEWKGNTSSPEKPLTTYELPSEYTVMPSSWKPVWSETECALKAPVAPDPDGTLELELTGDVRLLSIRFTTLPMTW